MDYSLETTAEDPWVRISDCIKNLFSPIMSENHNHMPLQPTPRWVRKMGCGATQMGLPRSWTPPVAVPKLTSRRGEAP